MTGSNATHIDAFDVAVDTLTRLMIEHDLCDGISGHLTGLTCDAHLYGDQVTRLTELLLAGLRAEAIADHPSNGRTVEITYDPEAGTVTTTPHPVEANPPTP